MKKTTETGRFVRENRLKAGLSQRDLGLRLSPQASVQFISNIERGVTGVPAARICDFACALQVPFLELIASMVWDYEAQLIGIAKDLESRIEAVERETEEAAS